MKKLTVKQIVSFRRKSEKSKINFVNKLKTESDEQPSDSGANYWVYCLSAILNTYKSKNLKFIAEKKNELEAKYEATDNNNTKIMYKRNIDILNSFIDFDMKVWTPNEKTKILKKNKIQSIITIKNLQIKVIPDLIFSFNKDNVDQIGSIWFIAQKDGYTKEELGVFTETMYRYLNIHYKTQYAINSKYCIAVDVYKNTAVRYAELENKEISKILDVTITEIYKLV